MIRIDVIEVSGSGGLKRCAVFLQFIANLLYTKRMENDSLYLSKTLQGGKYSHGVLLIDQHELIFVLLSNIRV